MYRRTERSYSLTPLKPNSQFTFEDQIGSRQLVMLKDLPLENFTQEELTQVLNDETYPLIVVMRQSLKNVLLSFASFTIENGKYNGIRIIK
jgi:hypothetical protein